MSSLSFSIAEVTHFTPEGTLAVPSYEIKAYDADDVISESITTDNPADIVRLRNCLDVYIQVNHLETAIDDERE